jgi:hypothetical protein
MAKVIGVKLNSEQMEQFEGAAKRAGAKTVVRLSRQFGLPVGRFVVSTDVLNVTNAGQRLQEDDLSGPFFNLRLPVAIQAPRFLPIGFRYEF